MYRSLLLVFFLSLYHYPLWAEELVNQEPLMRAPSSENNVPEFSSASSEPFKPNVGTLAMAGGGLAVGAVGGLAAGVGGTLLAQKATKSFKSHQAKRRQALKHTKKRAIAHADIIDKNVKGTQTRKEIREGVRKINRYQREKLINEERTKVERQIYARSYAKSEANPEQLARYNREDELNILRKDVFPKVVEGEMESILKKINSPKSFSGVEAPRKIRQNPKVSQQKDKPLKQRRAHRDLAHQSSRQKRQSFIQGAD